MYRLLARRTRDERGIALMTAVLISAIVFIMGATAVTIAVHNSDAAGRSRRRVESIGSAEAGLDYYFSHLQDASPDEIQCTVSETLTGSPTAAFSVTVEFYAADGSVMNCPMGEDELPDSALITSAGQTSLTDPTRTMQSFVYLIPKAPKAFGDSAIFSHGDPVFNSNVTVFGGGSINADIYSNGSIILQSNAIAEGSVFAQGNITVQGNAEVKRNVWAKGWVKMENQSVVRGAVTSSESSITLTQSAHIYSNARAGTTISAPAGSIDGLRIPNSPSDPPPLRPFPEYTYDPTDWQLPKTDPPYTIQNFTDCTSARNFLLGPVIGKTVVRINATCELQIPSNRDVIVREDLAIIADGGLRMRSNSRFVSDGNPHKLFLIFGLAKTSPCDITWESNSDVGDDLTTLMYTPCTINMNSNSFVGKGQMFGGNVNFNSNSTLTFELIPIPGQAPSGFDENITFIREVITDPGS